jgi:hypothetical protein
MPDMPVVDILLPTCNRLPSLIMTLSGIASQSLRNLHVIVADQSQRRAGHSQEVQSLRRVIDVRPHQQIVEYWEGPVQPEAIDPTTPQWERWQLHRAANLYHVSRSLPPGEFRLYKVAWIASCILYHRAKLLEVGGSSFWSRLPRYHSGEEVLVQNLLMRLWGGCAIMPTGTYYSQVPTTVLNEAGTVDGHALDLLAEMIERYAPETSEGKKHHFERSKRAIS